MIPRWYSGDIRVIVVWYTGGITIVPGWYRVGIGIVPGGNMDAAWGADGSRRQGRV